MRYALVILFTPEQHREAIKRREEEETRAKIARCYTSVRGVQKASSDLNLDGMPVSGGLRCYYFR